jgi:hypothetical protein
MTNQEATVLVARSILESEDAKVPKEISNVTGIPILQIHKIFNKLFKDALIASIEKNGLKSYVIVNSEGLKALLEVTTVNLEPTQEASAVAVLSDKKELSEPMTKPVKGRHTGMFNYKNASYNKSQCALKVLTDYVTAEKPTLAELEKTFPKEIVSRFGVFNTIDQAKELSKGRDRYYMKEGNILTTSDGHKVVVTTQWTLERILQFSDAAAAVGLKFTQE